MVARLALTQPTILLRFPPYADFASQLPKEKLVFLLMATYGDGDPTDSATEFWTWLSEAAESGAQEDLLQVGSWLGGLMGAGGSFRKGWWGYCIPAAVQC